MKTAFLNADMSVQEDDGIILIKPPPVFHEKHYVPKGVMYQPLKAVYGFRRSPRLWSLLRDKTMREFRIQVWEEGKKRMLVLVQLESEPNLWKIAVEDDREETPTMTNGLVRGLVMSYVDDIFITGPDYVVEAVKTMFEKTWTTSKPEFVSEEAVRFLGMEVKKHPKGKDIEGEVWFVTQESYISDLLSKEEGLKEKKIPISRDQSIMEPTRDPPTPDQIKQCQKEVGEALWLVTRTRPDLMFPVSRMGSNITKAAEAVLEASKQVKGYLLRTKEEGLKFDEDHGKSIVVNAYSDASFAPIGEESHGAFVIKFNDSPIFWRSGRQSVITLSTAEAELNEIVEAMGAAESISVIIDEIYEDVEKIAWSDSQAAVSIMTSEGGSWRTRHLRMKAAYARQAITQGLWALNHMAGDSLVADVGTKAVSANRLETLKTLMGMGRSPKLDQKTGVALGKESPGEPPAGRAGDAGSDRGDLVQCPAGQDGVAFQHPSQAHCLENDPQRKRDVAISAIQLVVLMATLTAAKGQEEDEEEEKAGVRELQMLMAGYTCLVILATLIIQWLWRRWSRKTENQEAETVQHGKEDEEQEKEEEIKRPVHLPPSEQKTGAEEQPKSAQPKVRASDGEVGLGGDPVRLPSKDPRCPEGRVIPGGEVGLGGGDPVRLPLEGPKRAGPSRPCKTCMGG